MECLLPKTSVFLLVFERLSLEHEANMMHQACPPYPERTAELTRAQG